VAVFAKIYKKDSEDNEKIREMMTEEMVRRIGDGHDEIKVRYPASPELRTAL
jgi:hypothetical protein